MRRVFRTCVAALALFYAGLPSDLARAQVGVCSPGLPLLPTTIKAGQSTSFSVFYECLDQPSETVTISIPNLPKGATFTPKTGTSNLQTLDGTVITINTATTTPSGKYNISVGGTGPTCGGYSPCPIGTLTIGNPPPPPKISCAERSHQVCPSLWWFNGVTPQPGFYLTKLQATPAGESDYSWQITDGTQYAQFSNNSSTIDPKGTNSVEILPNGDPGNDTPVPTVSVTVTVKTKDGTSTSAPFSLNARKPYELLARQGPCKAPACDFDNVRGYKSYIYYKIVDQEGTPLPQPVQLNEHFNTDLSNDYPGNNWDQPPNCGQSLYCEAFFPPTGWEDLISIYNQSLTPAPQNPGPLQKPPKPLGTTRVDHWSGTWSIGDGSPGKGVTVQMNTWQRFQDHGRHYNIVSPFQ